MKKFIKILALLALAGMMVFVAACIKYPEQIPISLAYPPESVLPSSGGELELAESDRETNSPEQTHSVEQRVTFGELVRIDLTGQGITSEHLAEMIHNRAIPPYITHLNLAANYIADIAPLSGLPSLVELSLWGNRVSDLAPLRELTNITHLDLWGNEFADLSPIADLINLVSLSVGDNLNFNGDLSVLRNFTQLTNLGLGDTWQTRMDFSPIEVLVNLEQLQLWGAGSLTDISIFNNLRNMQCLTIHASSVTDFSSLSNLTNLTRLDLQQNKITDISHINLERLTNLTELFLWHNQITDVTPLKDLTGLTSLWLEGNPLIEAQITELRTALPECEIR